MTTIDVTATDLIVRMTGWDKVWALKGQLTIPLAHVQGAAIDPNAKSRRSGLRLPGTHWPGAITAGTYRKDGKWF